MSKKRTNDGIKEFKKQFPEFWEKFEADTELAPLKKRQFKQYLKAFKGGDLRKYARAFCRQHKNQRCGQRVAISGATLGHVRKKSGLVNRIYAVTKWKTDRINDFLRDWELIDDPRNISDLFTTFGEATITEHTMWSYLNDADTNDPFFGVDHQDLPCRLGLPSFMDGSEHYAFGHLLPHNIKAKKPSCFDSDLCEFWINGGMTKPHDPCAKKYPAGLPELVHSPNKFKNIKTKLLECCK